MRCYTGQHRFHGGVDLHARALSAHALDRQGKTAFERGRPAEPAASLRAIQPYRKGPVAGVECVSARYRLADLCEDQGIPLALGHAPAVRHIHGGESKSDRIDAGKLAAMLRGGPSPLAYAYPKAKRRTRDLPRRRSFFVRRRAQPIAHVVNAGAQFNPPPLARKPAYAANRTPELLDRFTDPSTRLMVGADPAMVDRHDEQIAGLGRHLVRNAKVDGPVTLGLSRTTPGAGPTLGLTLPCEADDIRRFPGAGHSLSYARPVRCGHSSAGEVRGPGPGKMGDARLKWASSEAACPMTRAAPAVKGRVRRRGRKKGKRRALATPEARIGRCAHHLWRERAPFDPKRSPKGGGESPRRGGKA